MGGWQGAKLYQGVRRKGAKGCGTDEVRIKGKAGMGQIATGWKG